MSVNKVILVGYLGGDLEIKTFTNGKLASFNLATSTHWKDRITGEKRESAQWHKVKMNVKGDEGILPFLKKGTLVYLEGSIEYRSYTEQNSNEKKYITEIKTFPYSIKLFGGKKSESDSTYFESGETNNSFNADLADFEDGNI